MNFDFRLALDTAIARKNLGSRRKVANMAGVSPMFLQNSCTGESQPSVRNLMKLADLFEMKLSEFIALGEEEDND